MSSLQLAPQECGTKRGENVLSISTPTGEPEACGALGWAPPVQSRPGHSSPGQALQSLCSCPCFRGRQVRDLRAHSRATAELRRDVFFLSFLTHSLFSLHSPAPLPSEDSLGEAAGQRPGGAHHGVCRLLIWLCHSELYEPGSSLAALGLCLVGPTCTSHSTLLIPGSCLTLTLILQLLICVIFKNIYFY